MIRQFAYGNSLLCYLPVVVVPEGTVVVPTMPAVVVVSVGAAVVAVLSKRYKIKCMKKIEF